MQGQWWSAGSPGHLRGPRSGDARSAASPANQRLLQLPPIRPPSRVLKNPGSNERGICSLSRHLTPPARPAAPRRASRRPPPSRSHVPPTVPPSFSIATVTRIAARAAKTPETSTVVHSIMLASGRSNAPSRVRDRALAKCDAQTARLSSRPRPPRNASPRDELAFPRTRPPQNGVQRTRGMECGEQRPYVCGGRIATSRSTLATSASSLIWRAESCRRLCVCANASASERGRVDR